MPDDPTESTTDTGSTTETDPTPEIEIVTKG